VETCCHVDGCAPSHVWGALGSDDRHRDLHARGAVDAAPSSGPVRLIIGVLIDDRRAEEARGRCPRVRDPGFSVRARAAERLLSVLLQLPLDRFGLLPWATATQEPIVRVPAGPQASKVRVGGIACGQALGLPARCLGRPGVPASRSFRAPFRRALDGGEGLRRWPSLEAGSRTVSTNRSHRSKDK
jgi:hypothetical protein